MKSYKHPSYSYVHVTEIPFAEISCIDVVHLGEPTQSPLAWYNAQKEKPAIVTNGGFFNMNDGKPVMDLADEGKVLATGNTPSGMAIFGDKELSLSPRTGKERDYLSAYPVLIENGKATAITYATEINYNARRTVYAWDDTTLYVITVDSPGMNFSKLQEVLLKMGVHSAVNLDGGGSTIKVENGKKVTAQAYVRPVDNAIAIYLGGSAVKESTPTRAFRIALGAGHGFNTAGKRCVKELDPNETREWYLNDRICDYVEEGLRAYTGYELLRVDDSDDGADDVALERRVTTANKWGADVYFSVHHDIGINCGTGGGIHLYSLAETGQGRAWRDALYDALIEATGLKGNRATPKGTANFYVLKYTDAPAVLMELGFMDSSTDVPIILTDEYARKCAGAIVKVIAERAGLEKTRVEIATPAQPSEAETACQWAVEKGLFIGDGKGNFNWKEPMTREQFAIVLHRLYGK